RAATTIASFRTLSHEGTATAFSLLEDEDRRPYRRHVAGAAKRGLTDRFVPAEVLPADCVEAGLGRLARREHDRLVSERVGRVAATEIPDVDLRGVPLLHEASEAAEVLAPIEVRIDEGSVGVPRRNDHVEVSDVVRKRPNRADDRARHRDRDRDDRRPSPASHGG